MPGDETQHHHNQQSRGATTPTPHDALFRQFLSHPETARDFMALHLPPALRDICDLNTLALAAGSFIEDNLRPFYSDVLYSLKTRDGDGYIHILVEHQSTPDRQMAFRLMRYAVAIMQRHLEAGHRHIPLVIPILFYTGKRSPYPYSTNWLHGFANPALARSLYSNAFSLVDVTVIPDDTIMDHRHMAALTLIQKHIHQRDLALLLDKISAVLLVAPLTGQQLISLINYVVIAGKTPDASAFVHALAQRLPAYRSKLMTIAEQLELKGRKEGMKEGIKEGLAEAALNMLAQGYNLEQIKAVTGLSSDEIEHLKH